MNLLHRLLNYWFFLNPRLDDATLERVHTLLEQDRMAEAIQLYRTVTNVSLRRALLEIRRLRVAQIAQKLPFMEG